MDSQPEKRSQPPRLTANTIRQFGPVASVLLVIAFITVVVLPSSLNLPQSNPTTVLEYAPVPPELSDNPPPSTSGLSSLGLGLTSTLTTRAESLLTLTKEARRKLSKKCIGNRQTEDPNSPDCQSFFEGNNGGKTYKQGVTRDEVTIVWYQQTVITTDGQRTEQSPPARTICDVDLMDCNRDGKTDEDPHVWIRVANVYTRYFNERFQTYGRHVKAWFYWSNATTEAGRRADAADIYAKFRPFAVIDAAWNGGFHEEFTDSMAHRGAMVFSALTGSPRSRSYYQKYAPLVWTYWPDVESWAEMFSGYLCEKVAGTTVQGGEYQTKPREYGFYWTRDEGFPTYAQFKDLVVAKIKNCPNGPIVADEDNQLTFPFAGWAIDTQGDQSYGTTNVARWEGNQVNTIIWFGGAETKTTQAAENQDYNPEWIVAGDGLLDANAYGQLQGQRTWSNAWVMSYQLASARRQDSPSYKSYKDTEPHGVDDNWADGDYRPWFLVFTAIQAAGPRLNPRGVDFGMHAIARKRSTNPSVAACFYYPGNYTCVKDGAELYYDYQGIAPNNSQGCYRLVRGGLRYPPEEWGSRDAPQPPPYGARDAGMGSSTTKNAERDPCGGYDSAQGVRPGTPGTPGS